MGSSLAERMLIRAGVASDAKAVIDLHFAAVRHQPSRFYSLEIINAWSAPPDENRYTRWRRSLESGNEIVLIAEVSGQVCGFGSLCVSEQQLRALYVDPGFGRRGVGSALLFQLEAVAITKGLAELHLNASLNAEAFYRNRGFEIVRRGVHRLSAGLEMECSVMRKRLAQCADGRSS